MKYMLLAVAVFVSVAVSAGQTQAPQISPCTLKVSQAPAVRGIKLGMKLDDVLALFPGSREDSGVSFAISPNEGYPNFGVMGFGIAPGLYSTKERFAGIEGVSFLFVDGAIVQYEVHYDRPTWPRIDDFVTKIAEAFQLPPAANWSADQYDKSRKTLRCDGFRLQASGRDFRGLLMLATIDDPMKIQQERRAAFEEKARREFRP